MTEEEIAKQTAELIAEENKKEVPSTIVLEDFYAFKPRHEYIYMPTGEIWIAAGVNGTLGPVPLVNADGTPMMTEGKNPKRMYEKATAYLDRKRSVEQLTWIPGRPKIISGEYFKQGGFVEKLGGNAFNLYDPAKEFDGDPEQAYPWVELLERVYPDDAPHIIDFYAYAIQYPGDKINHALAMGGEPGIGKDTLLAPLIYGVGSWNFIDVSPHHLLSPYNDYLKAVVLRISEARDLGDINRYQFYDLMKTLLATPPDTHRINMKYIPHHIILNCVNIIITSNYKETGMYLPPNDRRHYVAWSALTRQDFKEEYWRRIWNWYHKHNGIGHVIAYLRKHDLAKFDPKAPPKLTPAFWDIANANLPGEYEELMQVIARLGNPPALTIADLRSVQFDGNLNAWLSDPKNRRVIPHHLRECGYVNVRNPASKSGRWGAHDTFIYARREISPREQLAAAAARVNNPVPPASVTNLNDVRGRKDKGDF